MTDYGYDDFTDDAWLLDEVPFHSRVVEVASL